MLKIHAHSTQGNLALAALGNDVRRTIVQLVAQQPRSTGQVAQQFSISRPAISKHLKVLCDAGLIERKICGTQSIYNLQRSGFDSCIDWLNQFWPDALDSFKAVAESTYKVLPDD